MFFRSAFRLARVPVAQGLYSTAPTTPPLLLEIRTDLKDAMRNKDTNKLNVLRSLLAEVLNASKSSNPPTTNLHILSIIEKTKSKSTSSVTEFKAAGRQDLVERETGQIAVLESYLSRVEKVCHEEILEAVNRVIEGGAKSMRAIMRKVLEGFEGRPVVKADVANLIKKAMAK